MTEMVVAGAIVAAGAMGAASLSGNLGSSSKKLQGMVAANAFASSLNTYLYSSAGCGEFQNLVGLSTTPKEISLTDFKYQNLPVIEGGVDATGKPKTATRNFVITSFKAYYEDLSGATIKLKGGAEVRKSILKINAVLSIGNKPLEFVYNVPVLVNSSDNVQICSDEKNVAESCAAAQGDYNDVTNTCELGSACRVLGTYNVLNCNSGNCSTLFGTTRPNPKTNALSCQAPVVGSVSHTANWTTQVSCGKKCTADVNNTMTWYICIDCPP